MTRAVKILFVCAGNICRSPTAEVVVRALLEEKNMAGRVEVASAGTHGFHVGEAPDARMQNAARKRGFDLSAVRSRQVKAADFATFDRILALDAECLARLRRVCPAGQTSRLGLLMAYATAAAGDDVPDPYYGSARDFDHVVALVEDAAAGLLDSLAQP